MSIEIKNITKLYGQQKAVDEISFTIKKGEIVGFLGPNGAGKSTTMKIITCYLPQNSGSVKVCGIDTIGHPIEVKKRIGYLPEQNPLYYDMYVKEYLTFIAKMHKLDNPKQRVAEMIEKVGLTKEKKKKIVQLSKGYKQRVGLAQAMIHNPDVLILDEPTSGLDPNQLVEIRNLIKTFGKEKTVMLSTHIMQEVEAICDRIIIINDGKIVADNTVTDLAKKAEHTVRVKVEFNQGIDVNVFKSHSAILSVEKDTENTYIFTTEGNADQRGSISQIAMDNNYLILSMNIMADSLEDTFKKLTNRI